MGADIKNLIFSKGRLETLTDGVFAIIMTILVFNITVPILFYSQRENMQKRDFLINLLVYGRIFLAYIISFATLGVYWLTHHRIFRWILNVDRPLIWINILFLMTIGFVPFSTTLLTQYLDQQISIFAYSFNAILAGVIVYALYFYAKRHPELVDKTVPALIGRRAGRRTIVTTSTVLSSYTSLISVLTC